MGLKIQGNDLQGAKIAISYRNTQGPCPKGFHIGSKDEWQSLINALTALGVHTASAMPKVLNIPNAYYLARSNGALEKRYGICRFWTSTMTSNTVAWVWGISEDKVLLFQEDKPGNAFSIRPFKDEPVIPDSSWTEFPYGVFKNTTLGLISIQNASNWITISDKNLGATNVGDKGLYYQFGNNHGFSPNPSSYVTSKPTFSDEYGPQNPYDSSVFVRVSSGNNWFNGTCNNIWGGVNPTGSWTQVKDVQAIYIGTTKVRPTGWKPGANTIAYYPLNSTTTNTDQSGHGNTLTNQGAVFGTYGGVNCANTTGKSLYGGINNLPTGSSARTISVWANAQASSSWMAIYGYGNNGTHQRCVAYRTTNSGGVIVFSHYTDDIATSVVMNTNKWYLLTYTYDGTAAKLYINGALAGSVSISLNTANSNLVISGWGAGNETFSGYISEFILENKTRTAQEVADYYNQTKGDYGL